MKVYDRTRSVTATNRRLLKLCYRCGKRFDATPTASRCLSEFALHEEACLQKAIESDKRKRDNATPQCKTRPR